MQVPPPVGPGRRTGPKTPGNRNCPPFVLHYRCCAASPRDTTRPSAPISRTACLTRFLRTVEPMTRSRPAAGTYSGRDPEIPVVACHNLSWCEVLDAGDVRRARSDPECRAGHRVCPRIGFGEPAQRTELISPLADLEEAVRISGNCAEALYSLGLKHFALNEPDSARHFLHSAERLDPNYSRSALSLALDKN